MLLLKAKYLIKKDIYSIFDEENGEKNPEMEKGKKWMIRVQFMRFIFNFYPPLIKKLFPPQRGGGDYFAKYTPLEKKIKIGMNLI